MLQLALLPASVDVALDGVALDDATLALSLRTTSASAVWLGCGVPSHNAHSRYTRTARDLPSQGRRTVLRLTARRFFCRNPDCPRSIFCERLPELATPHARSSPRLDDSHRAIAFALGGEAGSRLAGKLAMPTSGDTLLRRIKQAATHEAPTPRVLGVDDWAIRRGHVYGISLVDLERHVVISLLPGRDGPELQAWLQAYLGVEVISRDRATAYASAASEAAPDAAQVADCWPPAEETPRDARAPLRAPPGPDPSGPRLAGTTACPGGPYARPAEARAGGSHRAGAAGPPGSHNKRAGEPTGQTSAAFGAPRGGAAAARPGPVDPPDRQGDGSLPRCGAALPAPGSLPRLEARTSGALAPGRLPRLDRRADPRRAPQRLRPAPRAGGQGVRRLRHRRAPIRDQAPGGPGQVPPACQRGPGRRPRRRCGSCPSA